VGSFIYQFQEFDENNQASVVNGFEEWRRVPGAKLDAARGCKAPALDVATAEIIGSMLSLF